MRCSLADIVQGGEWLLGRAGQPPQVLGVGTGAQYEGPEVRGGTLMTSGALVAHCADLLTIRCTDTTETV